MTQTIGSLAEKRGRWVETNRENGFEAGLKRLLSDLYPDNAHFIYELLQNAEDAHAQVVRFILKEDRIEFEHDGEKLFSIQDVDAITSIGFSNKRDDTTNIGKFGVGFKAVFAYTENPEIESGEFHFRIRDMVVPEMDGHVLNQSDHKNTRFILPFNNPKKPSETACKEIKTLLRMLDATTLLFLLHIRKIEYVLPDSSLGYIERIELGDSRFEIRVQQPNDLRPSSSWYLKFDKEVLVEDEEAENEDSKMKTCRIAVSFGLSPVEAKAGAKETKNDGVDGTPMWELAPMKPAGRVCIYFPAEKETSNLRFHLHAPFASTVARDSVRDCAGNSVLRDHLADLLAESMHGIRNQDLLTVQALALLPNDKDNLPEFYVPLMDRLVQEFKEENLVPMKSGGHAAASGIFRGTRALSDLIDDDDLVTLLGEDYSVPMWAANPPQRNQREDNFISMLGIEQLNSTDLVNAFSMMYENTRREWLSDKDEKWHQAFYEMLMDFLNSAAEFPISEQLVRKNSINCLGLVRCSDGIYRKGSNCFFPTEDIKQDNEFPRVSKGVFFSGNHENEKVRNFLKVIGVREVDEQVEIEAILKTCYAFESEKPKRKDHYNHLKRFIKFLEEKSNHHDLFQNAYLFMVNEDNGVKWTKPAGVYLDAPFVDTGLRAYYDAIGPESGTHSLSSVYKSSGIKLEIIGKFASSVGAKTILDEHDMINIVPRIVKERPQLSLDLSRLLWKSLSKMERRCFDILRKSSIRKRRGREETWYWHSELCIILMQEKWVPQRNGKEFDFVKTRDAVAELLPEGFEYQTGWKWLLELEFGKGIEEIKEEKRQAKERQTIEYKHKEEFAKDIGFESLEKAEELAQLLKEDPEGFRKWKERVSARKECPTFPTNAVANSERRGEHLGEQLSDTPDKEYKKRERSVRTTNGVIDPITSLRTLYTNGDDQMICQICKEEMPFRKRDGKHYFEKKEILSRKFLPKEHEAQYLALCPVCAAKYEEYIRNDDNAMAELYNTIVNTEDCEVPITLCNQNTTIRFVETHIHDIRYILEKKD